MPEVFQVARNKSRSLGQRYRGDQQVAPANLFQFFVLPQAIELGGGCHVDRNHRFYLREGTDCPIQPILGPQ